MSPFTILWPWPSSSCYVMSICMLLNCLVLSWTPRVSAAQVSVKEQLAKMVPHGPDVGIEAVGAPYPQAIWKYCQFDNACPALHDALRGPGAALPGTRVPGQHYGSEGTRGCSYALRTQATRQSHAELPSICMMQEAALYSMTLVYVLAR